MSRFIVAEITKNWQSGFSESPIIAIQFETVIEKNLERGYKLHSFQLHQILISEDTMTETIIAVFERL